MLNPQSESLLAIGDACKVLPKRNGKRVSFSTVWRWTRYGVRGVYLDSVLVGGVLFTSREAIDRFMLAVTQKRGRIAVQEMAPRSRRAQQKAAQRQLDRAGW